MGLDTSHDCWHGSYGGFMQFREAVGRAAGLPYREYTLDINWDIYPEEALYGRWRKVRPVWEREGDIYSHPTQDDVLYLIIHSDCEGQLRNGYLPKLKARLEELAPKLAGVYYEAALHRFIMGLGAAIAAGEHVDFH